MRELDALIHRCQQGELAAFTELFRHFEARVYRLALTILRDEHDAEDALQDVFLRVFKQIRSYQGASAFETWLTAILVNTCRDRLRRRKVRFAISLDWLRDRSSDHDVARIVNQRQQQRQLWSMVDRLEEKYRLPVILHYHEGFSCDEVGRILDLPTRTIYSRLNTARVQLRRMLNEQSKASDASLWGTSFIENGN
jgi:RNA polymerase sigma-70 factor (ECF subfamily)